MVLSCCVRYVCLGGPRQLSLQPRTRQHTRFGTWEYGHVRVMYPNASVHPCVLWKPWAPYTPRRPFLPLCAGTQSRSPSIFSEAPHKDVVLVHEADQPAVAPSHHIEQDQGLLWERMSPNRWPGQPTGSMVLGHVDGYKLKDAYMPANFLRCARALAETSQVFCLGPGVHAGDAERRVEQRNNVHYAWEEENEIASHIHCTSALLCYNGI